MKLKFLLFFFAVLGSNTSLSQWSTDPAQNTPVCTAPNNQFAPQIVVDENGNSIIVWEDETDPVGYRHIYAQRLNRYGYKMWDERGVPVCTAREYKIIADVISDGHGGAIVVWTDWKNFFHPEPIEELDIYAQRIDSTGALLWEADGVAVCTKEGDQFNAEAMSDYTGGAIIVWQDNRPGPNGIYVQRINNYGETVWETNGIDLNDPLAAGSFPDIVTNGLNGAIISYHGPGPNCQNVDSSGYFFWPIDSIVYNQQPLADKEMIADGSKGFLVIGRAIDNFTYDIRIQRVNRYGKILWSDYGIVISEVADFYSRPELVTDGQCGAFITWTADTTATDNRYLYFSRVDSFGDVIWINNPISISSRWSTTKIISNSNNGAIFCYAKDSGGNNPIYYLQSVDMEGLVLWGNYGIIYSTKLEKKGNILLAGDSYSGVIVVWSEFPHDIYAQQISSNGNLGEVITSVSNKKLENGHQHNLLLQNYPNPFNASTQISYQLQKGGDVSLKIFNLNGQLIKTLINQKQKEGKYDIIWNGKDENNNQVASGIYLIELSSSRFKIIKKITLVR